MLEMHLDEFPEIKKYQFLNPDLTEDQQLAILTCPNFADTVRRALQDFWEIKRCKKMGCGIEVLYQHSVRRLRIKGHCPIF